MVTMEVNKLEIRNLNKKYRGADFFALKDVNISFTPGIYGILGENGAGKSTLFNIIVGILEKTSGEICFKGENIDKDIEGFKGHIGFMPQNQNLYPNYSLKKFLYYIATLKKVKARDIEKEVNRVLEITELEGLKDRKIGSLSGGMKQRLLISQALLTDPDILILDEPTAGLDPKQRIAIRNFLSKISEDKIVLISTHVVSDIEHISKEIVIIKKGEIILQAKPEEVLKQYSNISMECEIGSQDTDYFLDKYNVSQIQIRANGKNYIKICGDFTENLDLKSYKFKPADVNLEDVYIYLFEDKTK